LKILCTIALVSLVACKAEADRTTGSEAPPAKTPAPVPSKAPPPPPPAPSPPASVKPAPNVEDVLKAQLEAVKNWSDGDRMNATFAPSAIVLFANGEHPVSEGSVASRLALLTPQSSVQAATFDHVTSGHNANVAWFSADLHFTVREGSKTAKRTIRAIELLDRAADWKVVVASFTNVDKLSEIGSSPIKDATPPDALTKLLVASDALAAALDPNAVVLGSDLAERGEGAANAKRLLGTWQKLKLTLDLDQKTREVHTATYGYAMANVQLTPSKGGSELAMNAFVLALPGANGSWSVVAAAYGATF